MSMVYVQTERCAGCGMCVETCPEGAISLMGNLATINQALCRECETCVEVCPEGAILSVTEAAAEKVRLPVARPATEPISVATKSSTPAPVPVRVWPALGAALAFAGREILPRLGSYLLDLVDQRLSQPSAGGQPAEQPIVQSGGQGVRYRKRRRRGAR